MDPISSSGLKAAVEGLHGCQATFVEESDVVSRHGKKIIWQGRVALFSLQGHPTSLECYAWSEPTKGSDKRRFFAVLKAPPVDSPEAAVRASIMSDYQASKQT